MGACDIYNWSGDRVAYFLIIPVVFCNIYNPPCCFILRWVLWVLKIKLWTDPPYHHLDWRLNNRLDYTHHFAMPAIYFIAGVYISAASGMFYLVVHVVVYCIDQNL